ncbi:aldose epimerase family protein [Alishewanella sp. HL-SH05]|uniref:aldose epimerase family protein n=1 Tax=Alishewanella sp. HL-SH05 TaxID=3461145 RepID=UPI004041F781
MQMYKVIMQQLDANLEVITLISPEGLQVDVLPYGATIKSISVKGQSVTLQYPELTEYLNNPFYLGSTIGRYANRIGGGVFELNGQTILLDKGQAEHALHGGAEGFSHRLWQCLRRSDSECVLSYVSPDGENGFPGEVSVMLFIKLTGLQVELFFEAMSDADTVISLTNHCYFNLNAEHSHITDHMLKINAATFLPCDATGLPTGNINAVDNTVFDFRDSALIGAGLAKTDPQLSSARGFDHFFIFAAERDLQEPVAELWSVKSGIKMALFTTQPGLQFYTGNYLSGSLNAQTGLCLEAQHWPDAPNQVHFPSAKLTAGEKYQQRICYQFSFLDA